MISEITTAAQAQGIAKWLSFDHCPRWATAPRQAQRLGAARRCNQLAFMLRDAHRAGIASAEQEATAWAQVWAAAEHWSGHPRHAQRFQADLDAYLAA